MSHFFIITFPALLHLSPLEVKKVIKGLASDSSGSFSPPLNLLQTLAPSRQKPLISGVLKTSPAFLSGGVPLLTSLLNGGCFATHLTALRLCSSSGRHTAFYLLIAG